MRACTFLRVSRSQAYRAMKTNSDTPLVCLSWSTNGIWASLSPADVVAVSITSSLAPDTGGTRSSRPAKTLDHAFNKSAVPIASDTECGNVIATRVASARRCDMEAYQRFVGGEIMADTIRL